jgi:hypothetical protein
MAAVHIPPLWLFRIVNKEIHLFDGSEYEYILDEPFLPRYSRWKQ